MTELQICFLAGLFVVLCCTIALLVDLHYIRKRLWNIERLHSAATTTAEQNTGDDDEVCSDDDKDE